MKNNNLGPDPAGETMDSAEKIGTIQRCKKKWGITSNFQFWAIMLTFTLAGSSISLIRPLFWNVLGFTKTSPSMWIKVPTYLMLVFPTYQISLLIFGTLLGQFKFFWEKEKKVVRFLLRPFLKRG